MSRQEEAGDALSGLVFMHFILPRAIPVPFASVVAFAALLCYSERPQLQKSKKDERAEDGRCV
jgi:hypothetical protein